MYLSTIVISEFQVKQAINDLPLRNFVVLPFNVDHAMRCGLMIRQMPRDSGDDRVRVKDDFKLLAQCDCESVSHLISEDASARWPNTWIVRVKLVWRRPSPFCYATALMRLGLKTGRRD